jgi:SAM-dependent methyltransferase
MPTLADIRALNPWFYQVRIGDHVVRPGVYPDGCADRKSASLITRQQYRQRILVDAVTQHVNFEGKRILDVACNCGYWSSIYLAEYGAAEMVGIEGRERFIKQAVMLYTDKGLGDYATFIEGNVMDVDYSSLGQFDIVLCAGILYHLPEPCKLLELLADVRPQVIIIDTRVGNGREIAEPRNRCFNAIDETARKIVPTRRSLVACMTKLGYTVGLVAAPMEQPPDIGAADNYLNGSRICMLCKRI